MKKRLSIKSLLVSGIAATAAMTLFTYMAPLMGVKMNIPAMLANTMGLPLAFGWIAHFMVGITLALIYAGVYLPVTKTESSFKSGALYSLWPWLTAQIIVMPMMSAMNGMSFVAGLFSGSMITAIASFAGHLIYGIVLGKLYKIETGKVLVEKFAER